MTALHDYLAAHLDLAWSRETLDDLLGDLVQLPAPTHTPDFTSAAVSSLL
ncbi:hypothetical protein ABZ260_24635 [Streptosporangium sp. NPDC006013]